MIAKYHLTIKNKYLFLFDIQSRSMSFAHAGDTHHVRTDSLSDLLVDVVPIVCFANP